MININLLNEYYDKKEQCRLLKNELAILKKEIVGLLGECDQNIYETEDIQAEVKFFRKTTPEFLEFLKATNNRKYIKEAATMETLNLMALKYNFSQEDWIQYCFLDTTPYLYIKKTKRDNRGE